MNPSKVFRGLFTASVLMLLVATEANGWRSFYGAGGAGFGQKLAQDTEGNIYVGGSISQNSGSRVSILKYDSQGRPLKNFIYPSDAEADEFLDFAVTEEGRIYVVANRLTTNWSIVVFKLDTDGTPLWEKQHEGIAAAMTVDSMHNVLVAGFIDPEDGLRDSLLIKYQGDGEKLWQKQFDGLYPPISAGRDVAVDKAGNVFLVGFGFTINKFDGDGNALWEKGYAGQSAYQILVDDDGNAYVTGQSDTGALTVKLSPSGQEIWQFSYDQRGAGSVPTEPCDLALDSQGNVFVATREKEKYEIIKLGPDGTLIWNRKARGKANTLFSSVAVDSEGRSWLFLTAPVSKKNDNVIITGFDADGKRTAFGRLNNNKSGHATASDLLLDSEGNPIVTFRARQDEVPGWFTLKLFRTPRD